ncbi:MAG: SMP-30/gluconolactonase/LRE family protein [Chloroflexota bacterium]
MQTLKLENPSSEIYGLLNVDSGLSLIVSKFDFLEGPIWNPADQSLIFSDILGNTIYRWQKGGTIEKLRRNSYMANGNAFDHIGRVITCEHATSRLSRSDFGNDYYEVLATHFDGKELNSPNDVVVKKDGNIYFTDPTSGRSAGYGVPREAELPFSGVYRLNPNNMRLTLLVNDFAKPNGLCFSTDESLLYVNDTIRQHIRVFDVQPDGTLKNGRLFADLVGSLPGVADGMKVDSRGNVYSCGPGGVQIFTPGGNHLGTVVMPEHTANLVFGDSDYKSLYITASTSIYRLRVQVPGHPTFGSR